MPQVTPEDFYKWDSKSQEEAARALRERLSGQRHIWYCSRGRTCDGNPHEGVEYMHARADQWPPAGNDWLTWLMRGGRGSGKTRGGAEWTRKSSERVARIAVIAPTASAARDTCIEGVSGLIAVCERAGLSYDWEPSKRKFTFGNGCVATTFSGEEPGRLRGPQHGAAWLDEPAHIALIEEVWDNLLLGLRMGRRPRVCATTTPLPTPWLRKLVADPLTRQVAVSTYANLPNLAESFRRTVLEKYEGSRLGRQELHGEILEDVEGALWTWSLIEDHRLAQDVEIQFDRVVVGIDPAGTANRRSDETGIVVVARAGAHYYVLADGSGKYPPSGWARTALNLYREYQADTLVPETNYGGQMVVDTMRNIDGDARIVPVHSRRGKALRAEPVVALYEQGRVHHIGILPKLEDELTSWVPGEGDSPNRVDALVHAVTNLMASRSREVTIVSPVDSPRSKAANIGPGRPPRRDPRTGLYVIPGGLSPYGVRSAS